MSTEEQAQEMIDHFDREMVLKTGEDSPNLNQIISVVEYLTDMADFGYQLDENLPEVLDFLKKESREMKLLSNQISNYADMGDERSIIQKF